MEKFDFTIGVLGKRAVQSPISLSKEMGDYIANYTDDNQCILYDIETSADAPVRSFERSELLEKAGPRENHNFYKHVSTP